jgi:hypothetical protein
LPGQKPTAAIVALPRRSSLLGAWLAVLALAIQCLVIQPHVDGASELLIRSAQAAVEAAPASPDPGRGGVCIICQTVAVAGVLTLTAAPALVHVHANFVSAAPANRSHLIQRARSHNWQSRGPPHSL